MLGRKWGNGWQKIPLLYGGIIRLHIYYCFMEGYSIYIGTASTLYCRRATIIIRIDIQLIDIRYTNLWTDQLEYSIHTGWTTVQGFILLIAIIDIDRPIRISIDQTIGIDRHFHVPIGHRNR